LPRAAFQQRAAKRILHLADLHRQGRLRDRAGFCRAPEMAVPCQRVEIAKLPECDVYHQIILSLRSLKSISPDGLRRVDCGRSDRGGTPNHQRRQPWTTKANARFRAEHPQTATGGQSSSASKGCIAIPISRILWARISTTRKNSRRST